MESPIVTIPLETYNEIFKKSILHDILEEKIKTLQNTINELTNSLNTKKLEDNSSLIDKRFLEAKPAPTPTLKIKVLSAQKDEFDSALEKAEIKVKSNGKVIREWGEDNIPTEFEVLNPSGKHWLYKVINDQAGFKLEITDLILHHTKHAQLNSSSAEALKKEINQMIYNRRLWKSEVKVLKIRSVKTVQSIIQNE